MLKLKEVNDYIQGKIKEAKEKGGTALELFSICNIPVELLTIEEKKIINKVLCSLLKSNGYTIKTSIQDFFFPGDFYFKNKGYLLVF